MKFLCKLFGHRYPKPYYAMEGYLENNPWRCVRCATINPDIKKLRGLYDETEELFKDMKVNYSRHEHGSGRDD